MSNMDLKSTSPSTPNVYNLESAKGVHGLLHAMFLEIEYTSHTCLHDGNIQSGPKTPNILVRI
jgi:hypothetical protein